MEDTRIKNFLKPLLHIVPDETFMTRSKQLILISRQNEVRPSFIRVCASRVAESFTFSVGIALASFLIIITVGSISYLTGTSGSKTSLNNVSLAREAQSADFSIQIKEVAYFDESAKQVALALDKISDDQNEANTDAE